MTLCLPPPWSVTYYLNDPYWEKYLKIDFTQSKNNTKYSIKSKQKKVSLNGRLTEVYITKLMDVYKNFADHANK